MGESKDTTPQKLMAARVRDDIKSHLDHIDRLIKGFFYGWGYEAVALGEIREAIETVRALVNGEPLQVVNADAWRKHCEELRQITIKNAASKAFNDMDYLGLRNKLIPRPGWKGNKNLRSEVAALYRPAP